MAKRRLNQQQLRRISSNQQQRGKRAAPAAALPTDNDTLADELGVDERGVDEHGAEAEGLIICHYGQQLDIESRAADSYGKVFRCHQRSNLPPLVTGDQVVWQPGAYNVGAGGSSVPGSSSVQSIGVVVALRQRRSILSRPNAHRDQRPVAANVDVMAIVVAPLPQLFGNLIDRYLVAAESLGLGAAIILNKTDLLDSSRDAYIEPLLDIYRKIGYSVICVSKQTGQRLDELQQFLAQQTAVFVGQSGVGKSSLINALRAADNESDDLPEDRQADAAVGALSASHGKGTHTTTATRLYHLPGSGDLIDSPGIREFGLWHMDQQQLINGFIEFQPFIDRCKFRDCKHQHEPGCALLDAQEKGLISRQRLASYFHTLSTLTEN
jgi:ribosome biogenesis GTPase / thiamine phosphate phosphatase